MRFFLYSHDGLGLGHTRRHLAVATALAELAPEVSVLLATGADDVQRFGLPEQVEILKLPGLRKVANEQYASRHLLLSSSEIRSLRSDLLHSAVRSFRPNVVLVDKHPFGAKGEFRAGLEELKAMGGRAVLGLRDILDDPQTVAEEWGPHAILERTGEFYDLVLIYGCKAVFDPVTAYDFPESVASRTRFCGYVLNENRRGSSGHVPGNGLGLSPSNRPLVLATAGGGEDGFQLLECFLKASLGSPWQAVAVTGPLADREHFRRLELLAAEVNGVIQSFVPHLAESFAIVDALVCLGGYNTLVEAVSAGVPTVCVPRRWPRQEQWIRATAFQRLGLLQCLSPEKLNLETLGEAVHTALKGSRQEVLTQARLLEFNGAQRAASHLLELARQEPEVVSAAPALA